MVNMNHYKDPCVYGLIDPDGRVFYVGRTKINAHNRLWEHVYRARINHPSPVYQEMRRVGFADVGVLVLQRLTTNDDAKVIEATWIKKLIETGANLVNAYGKDGNPDSWSKEQRERGMPSRRGKATWIKGKTGEAAGWTVERRRKQAEFMRQGNLK